MFHERTLVKLTVPILYLFLDNHHLAYGKMKKEEKFQATMLNKILYKGASNDEDNDRGYR